MKQIIILALIILVAIFTGSWIFDALAWLFNMLSQGMGWLSGVFNFFGWNNGVIL
ncbi:MAG: hypothetical protein IKC49_03225 [Clostridia bacterium]|nr:hypothetical protein [Clostridia bacterium]